MWWGRGSAPTSGCRTCRGCARCGVAWRPPVWCSPGGVRCCVARTGAWGASCCVVALPGKVCGAMERHLVAGRPADTATGRPRGSPRIRTGTVRGLNPLPLPVERETQQVPLHYLERHQMLNISHGESAATPSPPNGWQSPPGRLVSVTLVRVSGVEPDIRSTAGLLTLPPPHPLPHVWGFIKGSRPYEKTAVIHKIGGAWKREAMSAVDGPHPVTRVRRGPWWFRTVCWARQEARGPCPPPKKGTVVSRSCRPRGPAAQGIRMGRCPTVGPRHPGSARGPCLRHLRM